MKNFMRSGETITVTAPTGGVSSGAGLAIGALFGVACSSAAEGEAVELQLTGVFSGIAKATGAAWTVGQPIFWDATAGKATTSASANRLIGHAAAAAESSATIGTVRLASGGGLRVAFGETALDGANPTATDTGLTSIAAAVVTLKGTTAPGVGTSVVTYGTSAGTLSLYGWKPTSATDPTLIASTGTETVGWVAMGT